jgi:hypothetical protein
MVALPSKINCRWQCHHLISNLTNTRNDDPDPFAMRCMVLEVKVMSLAAGVMGVSKMEGDDDNSTINLRG